MASKHHWPLSQQCNKANGSCSVCYATHQLHHADGTVHLHGPRNNRCPGSNKPPASLATTQPVTCSLPDDFLRIADTGPRRTTCVFSHPHITGPVVKHIPKSARPACASALNNVIKNIVHNVNDLTSWNHLLQFAASVLRKPPRSGNTETLTSIIKRRVSSYPACTSDTTLVAVSNHSKPASSSFDEQLARIVSAKLEDGNVRAALRIISSDDKPADNNEAVYMKLVERHPLAAPDRAPVSDPLPGNIINLQVTEKEVMHAIRSFPSGSAGGPDGLRPQHVLDMVKCADTGPALLTSITALVNALLRGQCAHDVIPILFGASLTALEKKTGGIRPIAVGYFWRRLSAKCANFFATTKLAAYFSPLQLGVGVRGGCEAAIHTCRRYMDAMSDDHVIVKLDFANAFNSIHRDAMLNAIQSHVPEIYAFCHLAYSGHSSLKFGSRLISSQEGVQQGDPLGPLIFCLTIHPLLQSLDSELVVSYIDDVTIGGPEQSVASDVDNLSTNGALLGLVLNTAKCERISKSPQSVGPLSKFVQVDITDATLLGAPLSSSTALSTLLEKRHRELLKTSDRLRLLPAHDSLVLLRASCGAPKLMHILRSSSSAGHQLLDVIDTTLRACLVDITNVQLTDDQWKQASLPVKAGGLGIRSVSSIASSAFLASVSSTDQLQSLLLARCSFHAQDHQLDRRLAEWCVIHQPLQPPAGQAAFKQSAWDKPAVDSTFSSLLAAQYDDHGRARLLAASAPHSGDWLHALPISSCSLRLDDDAVRVAVGLRLGSVLCMQHVCPCGATVDCRGTHGLSCKISAGRTPRHAYLNDIIHRALVRAGVSAVKEPAGLSRTDGKRPDGVTLVPWQAGRTAVWDVTVIDTLATSYLPSTSITPGSAAEIAAARKVDKYLNLSATHTFVPIALETLINYYYYYYYYYIFIIATVFCRPLR
jgi:hypothetical protein